MKEGRRFYFKSMSHLSVLNQLPKTPAEMGQELIDVLQHNPVSGFDGDRALSLIERGADLNVRDGSGKTVLMIAIWHGAMIDCEYSGIVDALICHPAVDLEARDPERWTAKDIAKDLNDTISAASIDEEIEKRALIAKAAADERETNSYISSGMPARKDIHPVKPPVFKGRRP